MYYNILAERVRYFKENEEGIQTMCKAMEDRIVAERNEEKVNNTVEIRIKGVRYQCGQPNVNLRQVPAQVND